MNSKFSAKEPFLGYLYQIGYGLLLIISRHDPFSKLFIEQIDDISIETPDKMDVYQTKYHIKSIANLNDSSPDLWKTIRIWSEAIIRGEIDPEKCIFNLVTTAKVSPNSIAFKLKKSHETRNIDNLVHSLLKVTECSTNETIKASFKAFNSLTVDSRKKLVKNILVIDSSINIDDIEKEIKKILCYSVMPERIGPLYERLQGWFISEVILQLKNSRAEITGREIQAKIIDIADSLKIDNLPSDFIHSIASDREKLLPYRNYIFVKQLELIEINPAHVNHAISDFHRAYSQKSKWLRDGLINPSDEIKYDERLLDDWERKFSLFEEIYLVDEDEKRAVGQKFYQDSYIKSHPLIFIREQFKEQYMITGCCHILSNGQKLGWHPDFKTKI